MKKKILVTGGLGYIGSHTCVELINKGFEVVIVDNLSNSEASALDGIAKIAGERPTFYEFDLLNAEALDKLFKFEKLDGIIHFAASKAVGESVEKPRLYYRNNLQTLLNLLDNMVKYNVQNIVFSSSCTVYGQPDILPVTEQTPVQEALSPYGNTKQICEEILRDTVKAEENVKAIALRYFNPVGAHDSALIGELPLGVPQNLMPFITQTGIGMRKELSVFGSDYDTKDGTCIRDYIHVVDLANAHIVALNRMIGENQKAKYEFFNVGTGTGSTVLEVINSFEKTSGEKLNYKIVDRREGDIEKIYADTTFSNKELGWSSEKNLDDMTSSAWKWQVALREKQATEA
ncbi:UDP-glucose 4-epimerase GalE [Flammeovirga kamogawensis]|uniref:UDP-glucose 4-epimerase n=1 Tax=Flammeovirga kamogawensis TaxID=373891 RepID=A0ABX8H2U6_9BACT|nr:UDP-glucose 4-epimerase GalE [Flammeovirga kamogawensis]MBB6463771.1 UDP-glucose 4-epimerase [Flammeovirga kamogawensis]QWG09717.1 UDP-glucose 4-epimerase GalE [Flammeovirga kamogawensis]TRX65230.1 UDP-glucose 4-epimerase GalE [Flammeovirga kamogawensis]